MTTNETHATMVAQYHHNQLEIPMNDDLKKLVAAERKNRRELIELRQLRQKAAQLKNPDPKTLLMIDTEIKRLQGE